MVIVVNINQISFKKTNVYVMDTPFINNQDLSSYKEDE